MSLINFTLDKKIVLNNGSKTIKPGRSSGQANEFKLILALELKIIRHKLINEDCVNILICKVLYEPNI